MQESRGLLPSLTSQGFPVMGVAQDPSPLHSPSAAAPLPGAGNAMANAAPWPGMARSCLPHMGYLLQAVTSRMMIPLLPVTP